MVGRMILAFAVVAACSGAAVAQPNFSTSRGVVEPAAPRAGDVVVCRVSTSLVTDDPDYDIVRYAYRWTSGARVVRQVTTAALSDAVPSTAARTGEALACTVTPTDGKLRGPAAAASATVG